ncbi:MAG: 3-dehydroquinate synthase [Phycisphaerales bacterium]|nr:3-dehydroquinate synthase [Phycisphaerales bacterium]
MKELSSSGTVSVQWRHRVFTCRDAFTARGHDLAALLPGESSRVLMVLDDGLVQTNPGLLDAIASWATTHSDRIDTAGPPLIVPGGEQAKNDRTVFDQVVRAIHERRICRQSFVLAVGGGAMLDAVGLAAATAHRGVRLIRLPSTTLSQADAGVGVKNGINAFGAKNLIGTFAPPWAVVNDATLLPTLSDRDWRAGLSEAIKVSLLKDESLLSEVEHATVALRNRDIDVMARVIERTADLHVAHIVHGGDPFETERARPLDFGHWSAHQLEQMTGFRLSHGDAVAIGLMIDLHYAALVLGGSPILVQRVAACLQSLGFPLHCDAMSDQDRLIEGIERFREHLGGQLAITMVTTPGSAFEVHTIDPGAMRQALDLTRRRGEDHMTRAG